MSVGGISFGLSVGLGGATVRLLWRSQVTILVRLDSLLSRYRYVLNDVIQVFRGSEISRQFINVRLTVECNP